MERKRSKYETQVDDDMTLDSHTIMVLNKRDMINDGDMSADLSLRGSEL